jgi:hypothetical protein
MMARIHARLQSFRDDCSGEASTSDFEIVPDPDIDMDFDDDFDHSEVRKKIFTKFEKYLTY